MARRMQYSVKSYLTSTKLRENSEIFFSRLLNKLYYSQYSAMHCVCVI